MSVDQRIVAATEQLEADVQLTHEIVNGDENTEVQTDGGLVPTHAKVAKDSNEEIIALLQPTVTDINEHAEYVRTEADRLTSQANEAKTARNEAVAARDDAEAIVYEGEATTTPTGGAIPVAYADGQIDSGWLPELRARFPYSGVIGSVDKTDLFFFNQSDTFSNRFRFSNTKAEYTQQAKLVADDAQVGDQFGYSCSIYGDTVVVGARNEDAGGSNSGAAYVFTRVGSTWTQQAKLVADDVQANDWFGYSCSIYGDTVVVGARLEDAGGSDSGAAYVFTRVGSTWTQQAKLVADDAQVGDQFGYSCSIYGDTVVVGARNEDAGGSNSGAAYVFTRVGSTWTQQAKLVADDVQANDWFGYSCSIYGDTVVVGAVLEDAGGSDSGAAYVFTRVGSTWTQQAKLVADDAQVGDLFGYSCSIYGDTVVVGARLEDAGGSDSGAAYVFTRVGSTWTQQAKLVADDAQVGDQFGYSCSIYGDTVVVGAVLEDAGGSDSGAAYVFTRVGSTWTQQAKLVADDAQVGDLFGYSCSIYGDTVVVGARLEDAGGSDSGAAYVFDPRSYIAFNIAGRFVAISYLTYIYLQEAESTAERAVAFDDVFLDWNGNINTYRSITPHRTNTGYDADAIATEHGYTKVQNGLYRTSDSATYLLILGRVARRNQGAYHPVWNPEGARRVNSSSTGFSSGSNWYATVLVPQSTAQTFNIIDASEDNSTRAAARNSGFIGSQLENQPEGKAYDAIYADDFTPLYYSAQNITDRQALLFDSFNRAVAGETFMGAEGTGLGITARCDNANGATIRFPEGTTNKQASNTYSVQSMQVYNHTQHKLVPLESDLRYFANGIGEVLIYIQNIGDIVLNDLCTIVVFGDESRPFNKKQSDSARPQFLAVDLIGSLAAMPQEWLDNGLPGNWLAVGEEGEDLIPDGTEKNYKLSRRALEAYLVLSTDDNGATWSDVTSTYQPAIEGSGNTLGDQSFVAADCLMVFYRTAANPFELVPIQNNTVAYLNHIHAANDVSTANNALMAKLINKVPIAAGTGLKVITASVDYVPRNLHGGLNISESASFSKLEHRPTNLLLVNPACKQFASLVGADNKFRLNIHYQEMKYNGTDWGDDNTFSIVDNQTTTTDLNGEQVIVGQKRCALPYHFDGVTL